MSFASYASTAVLATACLCLLAVATRGFIQASMERPSAKSKKRKRKTKGRDLPGSAADEPVDAPPTPVETAVAPPAQPKSLAEKRLAKTRRKEASQVRDMIDADVVQAPKAALVARIPSAKQEAPLKSGYSSFEHVRAEDWSEGEPDKESIDEQWEQVPSKAKVLSISALSGPSLVTLIPGPETPASSFQSTSSSKNEVPGLPASSKKARQNAARAERVKQAKEEAEAERLAILNQHRKERAQTTARTSVKKAQDRGARSENKGTLSGGMQAQVDSTGALIWE
jgi:hypothetical protein